VGHQSALLTGEWAWSPTGPNYHQIQDFGYRANHEQAVKAKRLIAAYYGEDPAYSYWNGCSSGGRGGLTEAMRYPDDFDGILADAPAINWTLFIPAEFWPQMAQMRADNRLESCKLQAFTDAALEACNGTASGIKDGLVDPRYCDFDPETLVGQQTDCGEITALDAEVVRSIWEGPRGPRGRFLWYGLEPGTPLGSLAGSSPFIVATEWLKWFVHKDPTWDWRQETYEQFVADFDQSVAEWDYALGTNDPDLRAFKASGGKVIIWHGFMDPLIFSYGTMDYYQRVVGVMPGDNFQEKLEATRKFARLFMAPNVGHCGGGTGPTPVSPFDRLVDWFEHGKAPDTLPARLAPNTGVNQSDKRMTRDLCMWPDVTRYKGGPITAAESFECTAPARNRRKPRRSR
jgi:hypothetical protein